MKILGGLLVTLALALPAFGDILADGSLPPAQLAERLREGVARQAGVTPQEVTLDWDAGAWARVLVQAKGFQITIKDAALRSAPNRSHLPVELHSGGQLRQIVLLPVRVALMGQLIRRGTPVAVRVINGGLTLVAEGRLEQDSRLGQAARVRVVNFRSNRVLSGTLTGPKEVTITLEGAP